MSSSRDHIRHASHFLQLGAYRVRLVLVSERAEGGFLLQPFAGEVERTIFHPGTIYLYSSTHPQLPAADTTLTEDLTQLQRLLDEAPLDWQILLP